MFDQRRLLAGPLSWLSCAVATMLFVLIHLKGIAINGDGWSYWQGAGSLLSGSGYTYFNDDPITHWPPLYSIYLALWSSAFGLTGQTLILANGALVALQAWLWCRVVLLIWSDDDGPRRPVASLMVAMFIGGFVALNNQYVLAGTLQYLFLPVLVLATWKLSRPAEPADIARWAPVAVAAGVASMLTHSSSVAFLLASAVMIGVGATRNVLKLLCAAAILIVPMAAWSLVRRQLEMGSSHAIGFGAGMQGPLETLHDLVRGVGTLLVPQQIGELCSLALGLAVVACLRSRDPGTAALRFALSFSLVAAAGLYVLFNVTLIHNDLSDRFVLFFPLLIVSFLFLCAQSFNAVLLAALVALVWPPLLYRSTKAVVANNARDLDTRFFPGGFITPQTRMSRQYREGPPLVLADGILISPPREHEPPAASVRSP